MANLNRFVISVRTYQCLPVEGWLNKIMSRLSFFVASQCLERSKSLKKLLKPYQGFPKEKINLRRLGYVLVFDGFLNPILTVKLI